MTYAATLLTTSSIQCLSLHARLACYLLFALTISPCRARSFSCEYLQYCIALLAPIPRVDKLKILRCMQIADCLLEHCLPYKYALFSALVDQPHNFHKAISTTAMSLVYSTSNDSAGLCSYCKLLPQSLRCVLRIFAGTSFGAECISAKLSSLSYARIATSLRLTALTRSVSL